MKPLKCFQDMKASYSEVEDTAEVDYSLTLADCQAINILQSKLRKGRLALECCQDLANGLENSWRAIGAAHAIKINTEIVIGLQLYAAEMASYSKNVDALLERSYDIGGLVRESLPAQEGFQLTSVSSPKFSSQGRSKRMARQARPSRRAFMHWRAFPKRAAKRAEPLQMLHRKPAKTLLPLRH